MKTKIIGIFICMLIIISGFSTISYSEIIKTLENIVSDCENYLDGPQYDILNTLQLTVVIESPDDGEEITEAYIVVEGYAASEFFMYYYEWLWEWEDGSETDGEEIEPVGYYEFSFDIGPLAVGENTITVTFYNVEGGSGSDSVTVYHIEEGVLIDSAFQAEQSVYVHDPEYNDDFTMKGPCVWTSALYMIAGKNTYLFGYPYNDRKKIRMTCCNKKDVDIKFNWVFQIKNNDETTWTTIWKSPEVTVPKKSTVTFNYSTPIPNTPFRWNRWSEDNPKKVGEVRLIIDPDHTGGDAPCNCRQIHQFYGLRKTHDIKVLFLPFTFKDGPNFPVDLSTPKKATNFDFWRILDFRPWFNGMYPLREYGFTTRYESNSRKNISAKYKDETIWAHDLASYSAMAWENRSQIIVKLYQIGAIAAILGKYDRTVLMVHPDILIDKNGNQAVGWAFGISKSTDTSKHCVFVAWDDRNNAAAHEISHTYGLDESYLAGQKNKSIGYWVNKKIDKTNNKDVMYFVTPIADCWIKKPNYKILYKRLSEERDPEVLAITGYINKDDEIELAPWYQIDGFIDVGWGNLTDREYIVRGYNKNGALLDESGFNVNFDIIMDYLEGEEIDQAFFNFRVEYLNGLHRIDILKASDSRVLASKTRSQNTPQVTITKPSENDEIKPGIHDITWTGSDQDGDPLTYSVLFSNDSGLNWGIIEIETTDNSCEADFRYLPNDRYQLKVIATDGWNTDEDVIDFTITKGKDRSKVVNLQLGKYLLQMFLNLFPILETLFQRLGLK